MPKPLMGMVLVTTAVLTSCIVEKYKEVPTEGVATLLLLLRLLRSAFVLLTKMELCLKRRSWLCYTWLT